MPQIGSEKNPIRMSPTKKIKISGQYLKNEDRKKYEDNYDRIFGNRDFNKTSEEMFQLKKEMLNKEPPEKIKSVNLDK